MVKILLNPTYVADGNKTAKVEKHQLSRQLSRQVFNITEINEDDNEDDSENENEDEGSQEEENGKISREEVTRVILTEEIVTFECIIVKVKYNYRTNLFHFSLLSLLDIL